MYWSGRKRAFHFDVPCFCFFNVTWIGSIDAGSGTRQDTRGGRPLALDQRCRVYILLLSYFTRSLTCRVLCTRAGVILTLRHALGAWR